MLDVLNTVDGYVWGLPLIILLLSTGLYLTFLLGGVQFTMLRHALSLAFVIRRETGGEGDISHFQALMTALSATVGIGNIAGVATAIAVGGPGAVFWMWMTGLAGMATKYTEALLAVKYRVHDERGRMSGGPMVYIAAIGPHPAWKALAAAFAVSAVIASFGIGCMTQSNSVAEALHGSFGVPEWLTGVVIALMTAVVILGGVRWIARAASVIVPVMILLYSASALYILWLYVDGIPWALGLILTHAFTPAAATGGFAGASVWIAARMGVARGIFSNESGLGSSPIAAAAAKTRDPVAQALVSMTQTFIDTLIVCSMTALVILLTGAWESGLNGASLTTRAFSLGLGQGAGSAVVTLSLALFAYSTTIGWSYYGERALQSLAGLKWAVWYKLVFCFLLIVGAVSHLEEVWTFSDIANGLMAFPNLVALVMLSPVALAETRRYLAAPAPPTRAREEPA
ncbi:MAG: sodium:alanine symporter family protein [Nitrospinae bacterium]|nr:sodium:alanine symporter family protein [Nitrospinota bacterium]